MSDYSPKDLGYIAGEVTHGGGGDAPVGATRLEASGRMLLLGAGQIKKGRDLSRPSITG